MVAYSRWQLPSLEQDERKNKHDDELNEASLPTGTNVRLLKAFGKALDDRRAKYMNIEKDYRMYRYQLISELYAKGGSLDSPRYLSDSSQISAARMRPC